MKRFLSLVGLLVACRSPVTPAPETARIYPSSDQAVATDALTTINFDSEQRDVGALHDPAYPDRITVPAGFWSLHAQACFQHNQTGNRSVGIWKNGTQLLGATQVATMTTGTLQTVIQVTAFDQASAGDYYTVRVYQTSGTTLNVDGGTSGDPTFFEIVAIH